jgi:NADH dehydrogenase (ubiquinone) 1 beta subcomplex subunit 3
MCAWCVKELESADCLAREAWRYTGQFSRLNRFKNSFPGLGIATVAFAAYCGYEYLFLSDDHHGHSEGHGGEHH